MSCEECCISKPCPLTFDEELDLCVNLTGKGVVLTVGSSEKRDQEEGSMSTRQELASEGFNQIAHKIIDLCYFEGHSESLKTRERLEKLAEIETMVYTTMGKISIIEETSKRMKP